MDFKIYKTKIKDEVIVPLTEYMQEYKNESGYNIFHIIACKIILVRYLKKLKGIKIVSNENIMKAVKWVVISLNKLNEKTEYCLIETDARESIWDIVQNSAIDCGLKDFDADITEEWREW
jgi:hypothetical protein